ncbi:competence lipoprotein ComL, putative [Candidatus Puniceispirillum marinum IMCC1322]|uniref:Outer membrane protein assembly factor BamD n=1 Tax=Puniceispirillum marinum (strain IMCC1322) TaxID=488538 RepID=D5BPR7_PUNMI|nr:competence lipoprotein ComL, putative [Candidatus Puniceispirillum marinum IMCC1322]
MVKHIPLIVLASTALLVAGCSSTEVEEQVERPVEQLYNEALNTALAGNAKKAAPKFEEVERQHPYSSLAVRAQLMAAWAFYQDNNYPRAIAALDRFVELNPADERVEYAYYLKALCYYEQIVDVQRDAEMTKLAMQAFEELVRRFPDGDYFRDATLKIDLTRSHLAGKEMAVGRFYLSKQHYGAALRRFENVVTDYDTTNQVPEALYRMTEAYLSLGLASEANRVEEVAVYNYPKSIWTQRLLELRANPERELEAGWFERTAESVVNLFD